MLESEKGRCLGARIARDLNCLRASSQFRALENSSGINLSSNDYIGLASDPRLKLEALKALQRTHTVGAMGSRLLAGNREEWEELEAEFARFAGTEASLYFGSGYAANLGLLSSILQPQDVVFSDSLNHASVIDGIRLSRAQKVIYPHCDLKTLERRLRERQSQSGARVIVTESVFSMEGDAAPLPDLFELAREYAAELVVDEAHAVGVFGPNGRGMVAQCGFARETLATVFPCGKALASVGAFVCGGRNLQNYLVNHARTFIFSTAMPPYLCGQIRAAVELAFHADSEREHLREIARVLRESLATAGLRCGTSSTHIVPVLLGGNEAALAAAAKIREHGFNVKAIRPPTVPDGKARIRISLTSQITLENIHRLAHTIIAACKSLHCEKPASAVHA